MRELEKHAGRFITPTLLIDGEVLIGFGRNMGRIRELLERSGALSDRADASR